MEWKSLCWYINLRSYSNTEWKLIIHFKDRNKDELYHLKEDPGEFHNLIYSKDEALQKKREELEMTIINKLKELNDPLLEKL